MAPKNSVTTYFLGDDSHLDKTIGTSEKAIGGFGGKALAVGAAVGAGLGIAGAKALEFGADSVKAFAESEQASTKLQDAFSKYPRLADSNAAAFEKQAEALAKVTRFDDDATKTAQATLAQYKLTGQEIQRLTPLMQDYAAKTGRDLPAAAEVLGKAIQGKGKALADVGIKFTDAKDAGKNYEQLMGSLRQQVGGFAEKEGQTAAGKLEILKNQFGEVQEKIGEKLLPVLVKLGDFLLTKVIPAVDRGVDVLSGWAPTITGFMMTVKDVWVTGWQLMVNAQLGAVEWIVRGAAAAFGWVPGIGGKLKTAAKAVEGFRDDVNAALAGIKAWNPAEKVKLDVTDAKLLAFKKDTAKAVGDAGAAGGVDFAAQFAAQLEKDRKAEAAAKKAAATAAKAAKKTALDIFEEMASKASLIFASIDAVRGRESAQRAEVAATEALNEALARQATLPVLIGQAEAKLRAARAAAKTVTAAEQNAVLDAEDRVTEATQGRKDAQEALDKAHKDGNRTALEVAALERDLLRRTNDLAIATEELAAKRREVSGDTQEVADAERALTDLIEEQTAVTKAVTAARDALSDATLAVVKAEAAYVEAQKKASEATKEAIDWVKSLGQTAGLTREQIELMIGTFERFRAGKPVGVPDFSASPTDPYGRQFRSPVPGQENTVGVTPTSGAGMFDWKGKGPAPDWLPEQFGGLGGVVKNYNLTVQASGNVQQDFALMEFLGGR